MVAAGLLGIFTLLGYVTPWTLLVFTFVLGLGAVMNDPAWQAINKQLNVDFKMNIVAPGDYVPKLATVMAGSDMPDLLFFYYNLQTAITVVDNSASGAVYKAVAIGTSSLGNVLYAANFRSGKVDVFDSKFAPAKLDGTFTDPDLPPYYAPFGIRNIDGDLFVTFAQQDAQKHDDVAGPGHGFVDIFDTDGHLLRRFASAGALNSPWGITRASFGFGRFSGDILIGNFGDGRINAFDRQGNFRGQLSAPDGKPIEIEGLWSLTFGGAAKSDPDVLYFTAGPNGETDGLFGTITPASSE